MAREIWKRALLAIMLLAALIAAVVLGPRFLGRPSCKGQLPCALERAKELREAARVTRRWDVNTIAFPLVRALEHADCTAAGEYARALGAKAGEEEEPLSKPKESAAQGVFEACGPAAEELPGRDVAGASIRFSRGECEGTCPVYTMIVHGDGAVTFKGHPPGKATLQREANIGASSARGLFAMLDRIGFERMEAHYSVNIIDLPSAVIAVTRGGETRTVVEDAACLSKEGAEMGLCYAETRLTQVAEEQGWVKELRAAAKQEE
jgi:hypothetical protein